MPPPDGYEPFLATILDDPGSDAPRLVYSDWLEEQGDPRGEFIRVQCELSHLDEVDSRQENLLDRENNLLMMYGDLWREEVPHWARPGCEFRRGFVEQVSIWRSDFFANLCELPKNAPVRSLKLHQVAGGMNLFRASAALDFAVELCFLDERFCCDDLRELLAESYEGRDYVSDVARLQSLVILGGELLDGGPHAIGLARNLANLQRLDLVRCKVNEMGLQSLIHSENLPKLTWLDLSDNVLGDAFVWALARTQARSNLTHLVLRDTKLTNRAAHHLAESSILANLQYLDVSQNAKALAKGLPSLRRLDMRENHLTHGGVRALTERFGKGLKV